MKTRLTELLNIEHPVMLAGMGGVSYHQLVAAVSSAGGYGCLGASTMSSEQLANEIAATRALTSKPFGVDLLTAFPDTLQRNVELLIEGGASTFVAGLGVPRHVIDLCHENHVLVISMCGKVAHAKNALDAGCDVVVAQGTEAGGHTGSVATMPLVPLIVDAVGDSIPVVAAGGNLRRPRPRRCTRAGRRRRMGRVRVLLRHPRRVQFMDSKMAFSLLRKMARLCRARSQERRCGYCNKTTAERYEKDPSLLKKFPEQLQVSYQEGTFHLGGDEHTPGVDPKREGYPAGQAVGAISRLEFAGSIVTNMVSEATEILRRLGQL